MSACGEILVSRDITSTVGLPSTAVPQVCVADTDLIQQTEIDFLETITSHYDKDISRFGLGDASFVLGMPDGSGDYMGVKVQLEDE